MKFRWLKVVAETKSNPSDSISHCPICSTMSNHCEVELLRYTSSVKLRRPALRHREKNETDDEGENANALARSVKLGISGVESTAKKTRFCNPNTARRTGPNQAVGAKDRLKRGITGQSPLINSYVILSGMRSKMNGNEAREVIDRYWAQSHSSCYFQCRIVPFCVPLLHMWEYCRIVAGLAIINSQTLQANGVGGIEAANVPMPLLDLMYIEYACYIE